MELQCDVCFVNFDLAIHRPKSLPCGHTICQECVENPALQRKCPTCRKGIGRNTHNLPDNLLAIRLIEQDTAPPCKKPRKEDSVVQQLQRGVDAARMVVEQLQQVVPLAVEALNRQLDTSVAQLRQMEEALEQQVQREAAGGEGTKPDLTQQLQLAAQLEHSLRILTTTKCTVAAEEEDGAAWKASVQPGGAGDVLRVQMLQLQTDGQLEKVEEVAATPATPAAYYVGPPLISVLPIEDTDLDGGRLRVNEILRDYERVSDTRCIRGLKGEDSEQLLRVLAPQLEELEIVNRASLNVMEVVQKMVSLRRLAVTCEEDVDYYPTLPLQLEELEINYPSQTQLRCVERMPWLQSLCAWDYFGPNLTFTPSRNGALRWLRVCLDTHHKSTMLSLIRAYASSLQDLQVLCSVSDEDDSFYFPDLGEDLAASELRVLRRLVLMRPTKSSCTDQVAACLLQRQTVRSFLPSSVGVSCVTCNVSEV